MLLLCITGLSLIFDHEIADIASDPPPLWEAGSEEQALAAAHWAEPRMRLSLMAFPGNDFANPHHFVAFMHGTTPWTSKLLKPVLIDERTGQVVDQRELPWYVTVLLLSQPLHFGDHGGMLLKALWRCSLSSPPWCLTVDYICG
jgi:uncharacterized iron-regulated membrane protein